MLVIMACMTAFQPRVAPLLLQSPPLARAHSILAQLDVVQKSDHSCGRGLNADDAHHLNRANAMRQTAVMEQKAYLSGAVSETASMTSAVGALRAVVPLLIFLVVNWAGSAEVLQIAEASYPEPLLLTAVCSCAPAAALPFLFAYDALHGVAPIRSAREVSTGLTRLLKGSVGFATLHLAVEFLWIGSLQETTVGTNTAIYGTYLAFVCAGAVAMGLERLTLQKGTGVLLALGGLGVIWASQGSDADSTNTVWGITQCLASTVCFAAYQLACDRFGGDALQATGMDGHPIRAQLLYISSLGLTSIGLTVGAVAVAAALGVVLPHAALPSLQTAGWVSLVVLLQMSYQLALFAAIDASSALLVSGGCITVIPTGFAFDYLLHGLAPTAAQIEASCLIISGFGLLLLASMQAQEAKVCAHSNID